MCLIELRLLFKWNRKRSSGKKKTKLSNTQRTSKSDQHGKRSSLSNAITLTLSKIKSYKNQHVGFENWPKMTSKSLETLLSSLLKWCTHGLAVGDLPGEGRNRGVTSPFSLLSEPISPSSLNVCLTFSLSSLPFPPISPSSQLFLAIFQWAFMQPPSLRLSQICVCKNEEQYIPSGFHFLDF